MNSDEIIRIVGECACEIIPGLDNHQFSREDRLADFGANSIDRAEIIMIVLERLSLKIPRAETFGPRNIGELADLLASKL